MTGDKSKERMMRGRIGAYVLHSRYDSRELTKAARHLEPARALIRTSTSPASRLVPIAPRPVA